MVSVLIGKKASAPPNCGFSNTYIWDPADPMPPDLEADLEYNLNTLSCNSLLPSQCPDPSTLPANAMLQVTVQLHNQCNYAFNLLCPAFQENLFATPKVVLQITPSMQQNTFDNILNVTTNLSSAVCSCQGAGSGSAVYWDVSGGVCPDYVCDGSVSGTCAMLDCNHFYRIIAIPYYRCCGPCQ